MKVFPKPYLERLLGFNLGPSTYRVWSLPKLWKLTCKTKESNWTVKFVQQLPVWNFCLEYLNVYTCAPISFFSTGVQRIVKEEGLKPGGGGGLRKGEKLVNQYLVRSFRGIFPIHLQCLHGTYTMVPIPWYLLFLMHVLIFCSCLILKHLYCFCFLDLIQCTNEMNVNIPQLADTLFERTANSSWVVVFKALITTHHLMMYGNEVRLQTLVDDLIRWEKGSEQSSIGL